MQELIQQAILYVPPFLLAISVHESAHAYIAYRLGDPTAKELGRITLNPIPHIDLFGFIALFIIHLGWAKPVPVNPANLKEPIRDGLWISLAGPASNLILAVLSAVVFRMLFPFLIHSDGGMFALAMIRFSVTLNIVLMVFNLFPLPPLDGFHILEGLVSYETYVKLQQLQSKGPMLLLGIIFLSSFIGFNIFGIIFTPIVRTLGGFLIGMPIGW